MNDIISTIKNITMSHYPDMTDTVLTRKIGLSSRISKATSNVILYLLSDLVKSDYIKHVQIVNKQTKCNLIIRNALI